MEKLLIFSKRHLVAIAILVHLVVAWFSEGFFHPDEHYYALDFAYHKLGLLENLNGNWEWVERLRPWLLPSLFGLILGPIKVITSFDPFLAETILRMISSLLALWALFRWSQKENINPAWPIFFWVFLFMHARTSSENWATIFLLFGLSTIPISQNSLPHKNYFLAGIFLALSFWTRFQMGFLILGLGLHMLFVQNKFKMLASLALTFVATSLIAIYLDYWGYQSWTFTPWEYLRANLIDAKIDQFGRSPWWYYPWQSIIKLTPFFAIPCLAGLVLFIKKMPRHQWVWMSVPFIVFHFFIGHKELRFLYPVLPLIVAMTLTIIPRLQHRPWSYILCSLNILLLLFVGLRPANSLYQLYRVIWNQPDIKTLYVLPDSKGQHLQWERKILTRSDLNPVNIKHINDIQSSSFWALGAQSLHDEWWENKKCQIHYRKYPLWVQTIDYFKWLKRSTLWSLVYCP